MRLTLWVRVQTSNWIHNIVFQKPLSLSNIINLFVDRRLLSRIKTKVLTSLANVHRLPKRTMSPVLPRRIAWLVWIPVPWIVALNAHAKPKPQQAFRTKKAAFCTLNIRKNAWLVLCLESALWIHGTNRIDDKAFSIHDRQREVYRRRGLQTQ